MADLCTHWVLDACVNMYANVRLHDNIVHMPVLHCHAHSPLARFAMLRLVYMPHFTGSTASMLVCKVHELCGCPCTLCRQGVPMSAVSFSRCKLAQNQLAPPGKRLRRGLPAGLSSHQHLRVLLSPAMPRMTLKYRTDLSTLTCAQNCFPIYRRFPSDVQL